MSTPEVKISSSEQSSPRKYQLLIDGKFVDAVSGRTFESLNPSTGDVLAHVAEGEAEDINLAVTAARRAFESGPWARMTPHQRGKILYKAAQIITDRAKELAELETLDNGKTLRETTYVDIPQTIENFEYFAGLAGKIQGDTIPINNNFFNYTLREPVGVCGQIIPWNFPLLMAAWKLAPALAAGNTIVLKPAEQTPCSAMELGKIFLEAGLPEGVLNIVPGFGETAGAALSSHMDVDKVAFTGSTEVGKLVAEAAARSNLKRVSLELGGKAPNVVFADADMDHAVEGALFAIFFNQGQVCTAGSRLFVEESIHDEFVEKLANRARTIRVGNPLDKATHMGPQVSREQLNRIKKYVDIGCEEGAQVLTGGASPDDEVLAKGYFFSPTILSNVNNKMRVAQEEIFGPVVSVLTFKDEKDLVKQANDVIYGLSAGLWTRDIKRAHRFARTIKAGTIWINTYNMFNAAIPFGGYKQSGYGREMGIHALELYTQTKSVWVDLSERPIGWFAS